MPIRVRDAIASAGLELPTEVMALVEAGVGPMLAAIDALLELDFGMTEPFSPARLVRDAPAE